MKRAETKIVKLMMTVSRNVSSLATAEMSALRVETEGLVRDRNGREKAAAD